jgi:hypothetical protein
MSGAYMSRSSPIAWPSRRSRYPQLFTATPSAWTGEESLLIRLVDELHDSADISEGLWNKLAKAFSIEQIFEVIALVGFYHTVWFFANGLRLRAENSGARPPE